MTKLSGSLKSLNFVYNFNASGGAISTIGMGVFLPVGAMVLGTSIWSIVDLASGGAAQVNIGRTGDPNAFVDNALNGTLFTFMDYNLLTYGFLQTAPGVANPMIGPGNMTMEPIVTSQEVVVEIAAFALTAGSFRAAIHFMELSL